MEWFESIILGLVQGLTEFLPVSSSGHLMIARELLGVELPSEADFLSYEVIVHAATVCATIVVFRKQILDLFKGLFKFSYNDQTDFILKICVSMIPVFVVGMFFKDFVEGLFGGLSVVGVALIVTAVLLFLSDVLSGGKWRGKAAACGVNGAEAMACGANGQAASAGANGCDANGKAAACGGEGSEAMACGASGGEGANGSEGDEAMSCGANGSEGGEGESGHVYRNGISYWQAFVVGLAQAVAVIPGLSRSGTTISTGLLCGVKRSGMAYFSFLMVLVPILGECFLNLLDGGFAESAAAIGTTELILGFISAFVSGLFACKVMIALVAKASLKWFALYCAIVGIAITILTSIQ